MNRIIIPILVCVSLQGAEKSLEVENESTEKIITSLPTGPTLVIDTAKRVDFDIKFLELIHLLNPPDRDFAQELEPHVSFSVFTKSNDYDIYRWLKFQKHNLETKPITIYATDRPRINQVYILINYLLTASYFKNQ